MQCRLISPQERVLIAFEILKNKHLRYYNGTEFTEYLAWRARVFKSKPVKVDQLMIARSGEEAPEASLTVSLSRSLSALPPPQCKRP